MRRRCLGCRALISTGSRCADCRRTQMSKYRGDWPARAREAIEMFSAMNGDICPGWQREPHEIAHDEWTCDHDIGPLCRSCNSSKVRTGGG